MLADDCDYCVGCFANLEDMPATYHVINKLDFPLFESEWTADEELLLFEGLEKYSRSNSDTGSATGERSPILSEPTRPGRKLRSIIRVCLLIMAMYCRYSWG